MLHDALKLSFPISAQNLQELQTLENRMINTYATLSTLSEDELQAIHQYARVSMIGASTRIENAQLTDIEIDWMDTLLSTEGKSTAFENNKALIENK